MEKRGVVIEGRMTEVVDGHKSIRIKKGTSGGEDESGNGAD